MYSKRLYPLMRSAICIARNAAHTFTFKPTKLSSPLTRESWDELMETRVVDGDRFFVRAPLPSDRKGVVECAKDALNGLDFVPAYYSRFLSQANRRSIVVMHKATNKVAYFASLLFVDDNRTVIGNAARVREEMRKYGLFLFGNMHLMKQSRHHFPNCEQLVTVTRHDDLVLAPRYFGQYQINKLIGTLCMLSVACDLKDLERFTGKLQYNGSASVVPISYAKTPQLLRYSKELKRSLVGDEYVIVDSMPFRLFNESNFGRYPDLYDTKVYASSQSTDLVGLVGKVTINEQLEKKLSAIDSASFVNIYPAEAGLHFKFYVYTSSIESALANLRSSLTNCFDEIHKLRDAEDTKEITQFPERVHLSIAFPLCLDSKEVQKRVLDAGFQPGVVGLDVKFQYMIRDESGSAMWTAK